jgi:hypothetical protein
MNYKLGSFYMDGVLADMWSSHVKFGLGEAGYQFEIGILFVAF